VHIPHANAYPIAGRVRDFHPEGYPDDHAMVPHGMAVSLTAPEAFRFTFEAAPERHVRAAELLAPGATRPDDLRDFLPQVLTDLMRDIDIPNGLGAVGYTESDVDDLVAGTLKQQRLLATAPREATEDDLAGILRGSLELW
jgi:alcohol dehydrogenase class IV